MSYRKRHLGKTVNLDRYFEVLGEECSDAILLIATPGNESECFKNIDFGSWADDDIVGPEPGEVFVAIIDQTEKKIIWKHGKEVSVNYKWGESEFGAHGRGPADDSDKGHINFTIDRNEIGLKDNTGLKILLFSKSENQVLDLFSVDVCVNPMLIIETADVDVFNLERRLCLNGLNDVINCPKGGEEDISKTADLMRRASYHISELLENPKRIAPYAKARLASFYADRKFLDPNYPAALRWINSAISSSKIDDGELEDSASVYHAVNQYLLKRNSNDVLNEKELYFSNMSPAGGRLRLLQMSTVILLKIFDEICKKHDLEYWAIAGTLLGAVRHKGFIPWDDDVDVGMLRSDVYKLKRILKEKYPDIRFEKSVMVNRHDAYRHYKMSLKDQGPVFIDIFVFDMYDIPVELLEEKIRLYNRKIYRYVDLYKRENNIGEEGPLNDTQKADIEDILSIFSGDKETLHVIDRKSIGYGADTMMPLLTKVNAYEAETIFPCKSMMFENVEIKIPSNHHLFLKGYFGDYYTTPFNAFIKKHTELSDENIHDLKKMISKYSQYILGSDTD